MRRLRLAALAAAAVAGAATVCGPMDHLAETSFAWHMGQHMVLLLVVPVLLVLAHPFALFSAFAGKRATAWSVRALRQLHVGASPAVALVAFVAVLWATHFSPLYEAALNDGWVHVSEHLLYVGAGVLFWLPVVGAPPLRPPAYPVRLLYLFVALPQGALLGFVLLSARAPLYAHYARLLPFDVALADQRDAAAVMWIAGGLVLFAALLVTLGVWARRERRAGAFAVPIAALAACLLSRQPAPASAAEPTGKLLYRVYCSSCHGERAQGSANAPSLRNKSASDVHLMLDTGLMPESVPHVDDLRAPAFDETQMRAIVDYVDSFSPHADHSLPVVVGGDAVRGRAQFAEHCAVCHGAAGGGASVGAENVAPSLHTVTTLQVAEAIRAGPGVMPRFGSDVLTADDVAGIARYVVSLQRDSGTPREDRGGIALGHVGPVAEGFVAWVFGIGSVTVGSGAIAAAGSGKG